MVLANGSGVFIEMSVLIAYLYAKGMVADKSLPVTFIRGVNNTLYELPSNYLSKEQKVKVDKTSDKKDTKKTK